MDRALPHRVVKAASKSPTTAALAPRSAALRFASLAYFLPERQDADDQQRGRQEDGHETKRTPCPSTGRRLVKRGSQETRESEEGSGQCLRGTVAGQEVIRGDPAFVGGCRLEKRQHDVAAAKHQGPHPKKRSKLPEPENVRKDFDENRQRPKQPTKGDERACAESPARLPFSNRSLFRRTEILRSTASGIHPSAPSENHHASERTRCDDPYLHDGARHTSTVPAARRATSIRTRSGQSFRAIVHTA